MYMMYKKILKCVNSTGGNISFSINAERRRKYITEQNQRTRYLVTCDSLPYIKFYLFVSYKGILNITSFNISPWRMIDRFRRIILNPQEKKTWRGKKKLFVIVNEYAKKPQTAITTTCSTEKKKVWSKVLISGKGEKVGKPATKTFKTKPAHAKMHANTQAHLKFNHHLQFSHSR